MTTIKAAQEISWILDNDLGLQVGAELRHLPEGRERFEVKIDGKIFWVTVEEGF